MARPVPDGLVTKILRGMLISGEKILSDDTAAYQREILQFYDNAIAVDMESFGVACAIYSSRLTRHYNPQYLVIRGVSDVLRPLPENPTEEDLQAERLANNEERALWKRYGSPRRGGLRSRSWSNIFLRARNRATDCWRSGMLSKLITLANKLIPSDKAGDTC